MPRNPKAQVAVEYLILVAFLLVVVGFMFSYALTNYQLNSDVATMKAAVDSLASAADQVYALGPGNIIYIEITLSATVQSYSLSNKTVSYFAVISGQSAEFYSQTKADLSGSLPTTSGRRIIKVEALSNTVSFSEYTG